MAIQPFFTVIFLNSSENIQFLQTAKYYRNGGHLMSAFYNYDRPTAAIIPIYLYYSL